MARAGSGSRRSRGMLMDAVDTLTRLGLQLGAVVFICVSAYLLWGVVSGSLARIYMLPQADQARVWANLKFAWQALSISGIALIFSAAIRYYADEVTGYALLIGGASFYWGIPMFVGTSAQMARVMGAAGLPLGYTITQFRVVGLVALVVAAPLMVSDFWYKLRGVRRPAARGAVTIPKEGEGPRSRVYLFCWQMPYCRDYLRRFCRAYEQRKSCWRLKSGCYCDEDMILRVMKRSSTSRVAGFDQRYSEVHGGSKNLTGGQKRRRCRQCFLYAEHQKQKYRILSPLVFPAAVGVMWMYLKPAKTILQIALDKADALIKTLSMHASSNPWANAPAATETVQWIFLLCLCMILITYMLRFLEYCIFDLQI
ncbi:MAG TPA: hypothetical protein VMX94_01255 [Armatimonadota bacterium]|nr:hypothetical protein [Armatimonadota bacterium]